MRTGAEKEDLRKAGGAGRRMEDAARRETARGAERAMVRRESILDDLLMGLRRVSNGVAGARV